MPSTKTSLNPDSPPTKASWRIFGVGLAIFILCQTGLVLDVQLSRVLPPEADDAYCYIYNAIQLRQGFNYSTPAMKDLRSQAQPEPGDSIDRQNLKWELHHSLFFTHYLLHSAILLVISWISGVSLETAYKISCVLGSLLIAGAISFFLLTITDRLSAGLALGSLALTMFPMQGIHYVVPTNLSMALGLILLCLVLRTGGQVKWSLFFLSIVCLLIHRTGVIYAVLGVFTSILWRYKENKRKLFLDLFPTLVIIGFFVLITFIFPLPIFHLSPMAHPPDTNYLKEVWYNAIELFKLFGQWFLHHGVIMGPQQIQNMIASHWLLFLGLQLLGLALFITPWFVKKRYGKNSQIFRWILSISGALILLPSFSVIVILIVLRAGWLYPPQEKKNYLYYVFFLFLFLLVLSLLHVMYIAEPGHPILRADLTNRLWVPFALVLAAIFARGLWWVIQQIITESYNFVPQNLQKHEFLGRVMKPQYLWLVLVIFFVAGYLPGLVQAYDIRENIKYFMVVRQNVVFDQDQINSVLEKNGPQNFMIYDDTLIRHYILSHGGLERRAIYLPLLPLPESFQISPETPKYEIGWNPFLAVQHYENVRDVQYPLIIPGGSTLKLSLDPQFQPEELQILPGSQPRQGTSSRLSVIRRGATGATEQKDIHLSGNDWQSFPLQPLRGGSLLLVNLDPDKPLLVGGLNFSGQHTFLWPWQGVEKVILIDVQRHLQRSALLPKQVKIKGINYELEVLQDSGSTVLWRLRPEDQKNFPATRTSPGNPAAHVWTSACDPHLTIDSANDL